MLVNGQSFAGVSHLLDWIDNHDAVLGWIVINPTLDSVTEAKVTTADFDAEFGTAAAAVVSSQTKSGTHIIHGSAFEFLRNECRAECIVGSAFRAVDMSFFKNFAITERMRFQFRAESFNFANHTNLGQPNGCVDCPGVAGRIFAGIGNYVPRQWQMAGRFEF